MLSMAIFPLWWSSFSEEIGRRTIYLISFTLFVIFTALAAVSNSIAMLVVMRILSGGAAASVQPVGAGTIADIWDVGERGRAMSLFYLGPLMGPFLAPIIGGALAQGLGWRSTQWFLVVFGGVILTFLFFALPETLHTRNLALIEPMQDTESGGSSALRQVSSVKSVQRKAVRYANLAKRCLFEPLKVLMYLRNPAVLITVYYASIAFGSLYLLNVAIETTFSSAPYNFSPIIVGLMYVPNSLGYLLASIFGGPWIDRIMAREAKKAGRYDESGKLKCIPEDRMRENAWLAAVMFPAAMLWFGWTAEKGVFWVVPVSILYFSSSSSTAAH